MGAPMHDTPPDDDITTRRAMAMNPSTELDAFEAAVQEWARANDELESQQECSDERRDPAAFVRSATR